MDPQSKDLLQKTFALAEENNKMLRHIRRSQKVANIMSIIYWLIIIGIAIGAFYFLQPYITQIEAFIKNSGVTLNKIGSYLPR